MRFLVGFLLLSAFALTGCGTVAPQVSAEPRAIAATSTERLAGTLHHLSPASYEIVYRFDGSDGVVLPLSPLLPLNGLLYGTTNYGSPNSCACGTVFQVSPAGAENVIYTFQRATGAAPSGGLTAFNGSFYGTTRAGGSRAGGVVYAVTAAGKYHVVYSFQGGVDGSQPSGRLVVVNGALYGVTQKYGSGCICGTVFAVTPSGHERVVHRFGGGKDGAIPNGGLVVLNGVLWGTTQKGGPANLGTVFAIDPAGSYRVVYSFKAPSDGMWPQAGLVAMNGVLYGTTQQGGSSCDAGQGCGTVFSLIPSGQKLTLHQFAGDPGDGRYPMASLLSVNGNLYGTTEFGGTDDQGMVFEVTPAGQEHVVYEFQGPGVADGQYPTAPLVELGGLLYGTTRSGGDAKCNDGTGCGIVFKLSP